jgi:hypothetical protein
MYSIVKEDKNETNHSFLERKFISEIIDLYILLH